MGYTTSISGRQRALTEFLRTTTLFEHQQLACEVLDFHWLSEAQRRALSGALRLELVRTRDRQQLLIFARRWLYEHRLLIMHERSIRSTIVKARQQYEVALAKGIHAAIDDERLAGWGKALVTPRESGVTLQSWLWAPPATLDAPDRGTAGTDRNAV